MASIDAALLARRLGVLADALAGGGGGARFGAVKAIGVPAGPAAEEFAYKKSASTQLWLFGYELTDTLVAVLATEDIREAHVVSSAKKCALLEPTRDACLKEGKVTLVLHEKEKGDDGKKHMADVLKRVKEVCGDSGYGHIAKEHTPPFEDKPFLAAYDAALKEAAITPADVSAGLATCMGPKDEGEVLFVRKAALLTTTVLNKFVIPEIEEAFEQDRKLRHSKLSELTEEKLAKPADVGVKLSEQNVEICYQPIFQSGGSDAYDLRPSAASDENTMSFDTILVSLGARYNNYCTNISRTIMIDPDKAQEAAYAKLLAAHAAAAAALVDGATLSDVYAAAKSALGEDLAPKLTKSAGYVMGLEFREASLVINAKATEAKAKAGMVFNLSLGLTDLQTAKGKAYALQIADTVVVKPGGEAPNVLTQGASKEARDVTYNVENDEEEKPASKPKSDKTEAKAKEKAKAKAPASPGGPKVNVIKDNKLRDQGFEGDEGNLADVQKKLAEVVNAQTKEIIDKRRGRAGSSAGTSSSAGAAEPTAYKSPSDVPSHSTNDTIIVDGRNEAVLLPIMGHLVPFHVTMVKSIAMHSEQEHAFLRFLFNTPTATGAAVAGFPWAQQHPDLTYVKEINFKSLDTRHANKVVTDLKLLKKTVTSRMTEQQNRASLVTQEKLKLSKERVYRLQDCWIRPNFGGRGRKMPGNLEAHYNGFRYRTNGRDEQVDIMYANIKHAIFQPCEKDLITLLHFHLHDAIMIGKKKVKDVQFYTEVVEGTVALDGGRRSMYDADELEEEQRERERKARINKGYKQFVSKIQELWEANHKDLQLEFDIPFRELGFEGVPHKATSFVMPCTDCLVELVEMPFFVISLNEILLVNLERVGFSLKNFDMTIVFKDLERPVQRIDAIPSDKLEVIQGWLTKMRIKYYESRMNLNWKPILTSILDDPEKFFEEEGGWEFLNLEADDDEEEEEEEESSFAPSSESSEEDDDDDEDEDDDDDDDDDDDEDVDEEELDSDERGMSWSEMEEEARKADKAKALEEEDDGRGKKRKSSAVATGSKRRR